MQKGLFKSKYLQKWTKQSRRYNLGVISGCWRYSFVCSVHHLLLVSIDLAIPHRRKGNYKRKLLWQFPWLCSYLTMYIKISLCNLKCIQLLSIILNKAEKKKVLEKNWGEGSTWVRHRLPENFSFFNPKQNLLLRLHLKYPGLVFCFSLSCFPLPLLVFPSCNFF
jgi:hypothetical protein